MSSAAASSPATPKQVTCETSDQQQIAVELDVLRLSHTFDDMYKNLGLDEEGGEFPGTFPVKNIEARVFKKVVDWCKAHKGQPDPVVEKEPFTQESKRFEFTDDDRAFFDMPVPELLELVTAASYLDIGGLYHYSCQAIADLVKGKETLETRHILQQQFDLKRTEVSGTRAECPWLNPEAEVVGKAGDVPTPIDIPTEVLNTIFEKLTRADLERLQLVSRQFHNIIFHNEKLPLRPLDEVHLTSEVNHWDYSEGPCKLVLGVGKAMCLKSCAWRNFFFGAPLSNAHYALLLRAKSAWKDAKSAWKDTAEWIQLDGMPSSVRTRLLTKQLLFRRELHISGFTARSPHSFMHLQAIVTCNYLDISKLRFKAGPGMTRDSQLEPADVVEWLEHDTEKERDAPRYMDLYEFRLGEYLVRVVDALKKAFLEATSPKPYSLRIGTFYAVHVNEQFSNALGEQLHIRTEKDDTTWWETGVTVERK